MSYQIRPIEFEGESPEIDRITQFVCDESSQKVVVTNREFSGQFSMYIEKYPNDVLSFSRNPQSIIISGDAGEAPALCEILYTCLLQLGGKSMSEIELLALPISDREIDELNNKVRKELRVFGIAVWFYILLAVVFLSGLAYLLVSWAI